MLSAFFTPMLWTGNDVLVAVEGGQPNTAPDH
jgi:hypothetical protein